MYTVKAEKVSWFYCFCCYSRVVSLQGQKDLGCLWIVLTGG